MSGNYLITVDNWFYAPDGKQYRAVWGNVSIVSDSILGIKTNVRSSNWFAKVGTEDNHVIIAGCQIHYAVKTLNKPESGQVEEGMNVGSEYKPVTKDCAIYFAIDKE